ncbi:MAG: phosphoglycerate kinase [Rhodothermales bacterium]|nr:phosphoglycerate kinase [Rhodothermales bacterium]
MDKLPITDLDIAGKTILVRADLNVPLNLENPPDEVVTDDTRIRASIPTIEHIVQARGKVVLMSHLGRPGGTRDDAYSLKPVAEKLSVLLEREVTFLPDTIGPDTQAKIASAAPGSVILLENTRFYPQETANDDEFARQLAANGDIFVNDAFGTAHRAHASTVGITAHVEQSAMGFLLAREVDYLSKVLHDSKPPFVAILGGAKVSDKIGLIENLLDRTDKILIGGAMSYTFLKAQGKEVGLSRVEDDKLAVALDLLQRSGGKIELPTDHVTADEFAADAAHHIDTDSIDIHGMGLDIGPATRQAYSRVIMDARTIVWNGPMGVFEMPAFAHGTIAIAEALASATRQGALTVVGGGDSVAAISQAELDDDVSHVSTGGGAMLEYLEGKVLPGIAALSDRKTL